MNLDKYKITRFEQDELKPEETLADALSIHPTMETPISRSVFNVFYVVAAVVFVFFIFESFQLQIVNGKRFTILAEQSNSLRYQLSPLRGLIYDSRGKLLAENLPVFDLMAVHTFLPESDDKLTDMISRLSPIINQNSQYLTKIFNDNQDQAVFLVKNNLTKDEMVKIETMSLPGLFTVANVKRFYPDGPAAAHILGYTAKVTPDELKNDGYFMINDRVGRLGLEAQYERFLRGEHRSFDFLNNDSTIFDKKGLENAEAGNNLFLNIDSSIQNQLYKSISSVFTSGGIGRGTAVIQNPKTGIVLGLVSMPTFDNNIFESAYLSDNISRISRILNDSNKPLLNRAVSGRYSPGSTIKPFLALAGLKERVVTPSTILYAGGSINVQSEVDPNVYYTFRDWKVHGWSDIKKAIADSVDVYFYSLGGGHGSIKEGLGIDRIAAYLKSAGADKITGIDLPGETVGLVPSKEWKRETKGEPWYVGDTYNISIGQGDLVVTPIWINTYIGAIANGGNLMKPRIVREIKNQDGSVIAGFNSQVLGQMPFEQDVLNVVRQGMRQAVLSGTATLLQDVPVALAAKTGTAQVSGRGLNSLFTVFGPYDDPEIVITVLVENINQSQGLAIRVANDFLLWYFNHSRYPQTE
ncbi:MAG: penicillin-binding protein 2 [Candidatus Yanofskybacteria bacterium]|nr:penicillin-binding protein 2 [Candidatus Yanofskybacteria bacterium]